MENLTAMKDAAVLIHAMDPRTVLTTSKEAVSPWTGSSRG